jgi:Domain of unknown function (DUF1932)
VYKGMTGLFMQAIRTADRHGVLDEVLADLAEAGLADPTRSVVVAATKAARFVPEFEEIALTQRDAGLPAALFEGFAEVYRQVTGSELAGADPESVDRAMPAREAIRLLTKSQPS